MAIMQHTQYVSSWLLGQCGMQVSATEYAHAGCRDNRGIISYHGRSWNHEQTCHPPDPENMKRVRKAPELRKQSAKEIEQAELANLCGRLKDPAC
jgi:hypothetical protein